MCLYFIGGIVGGGFGGKVDSYYEFLVVFVCFVFGWFVKYMWDWVEEM